MNPFSVSSVALAPSSSDTGGLPAGWGIRPGESESAYLARLRTAHSSDNPVVNDTLASAVQSFYAKQLHAVNDAIGQAKTRNDVAAVQGLIPVYKINLERYRAAGAGQLDLSASDRFLLGLDKWVRDSLDALPGAIAAVPNAITAGLLKAFWPILLGVGVYLVLSNPTLSKKIFA